MVEPFHVLKVLPANNAERSQQFDAFAAFRLPTARRI